MLLPTYGATFAPRSVPAQLSSSTHVLLTKYVIHVRTSNLEGAGTSGKVRLLLFGDVREEELRLENNLNHSKPFKRGCEDIFEFQIASLGILQSANVMFQHGSNSAWHLQEVEVLDTSSMLSYLFGYRQWVSPDRGNSKAVAVSDSDCSGWVSSRLRKPKQRPFKSMQDLLLYKVRVRTTEIKGAGTDSNVFISITGELHSVQSLELHYNGLRDDKFESGSEDFFDLHLPPLGNIDSIKIMHDNSGGFGSAWHLQDVEITDTSMGKSFLFECSQWLSKDEGPATVEKPYDSDSNMLISLVLENPKVEMVSKLYK